METARILIVDDNPEIREIIRILLQGEGYDIEEAKNGTKALEMLGLKMFDLIILDIMMPERIPDLSGDPEAEQRADFVFKREGTGERQNSGIFQRRG